MTDISSLRKDWRGSGASWNLAQLQTATQDALLMSDMNLAIDIARTAITKFDAPTTSQYQLAFAYANCGSQDEVFEILNPLLDVITEQDEKYVDTLGLVGRVEKDQYIRTFGQPEADEHLVNALEAYHTAYQFSNASYPGINAATLFLMANDRANARKLAVKIITENAADQDEFWQLATLAEAHLLIEEFDSARHYYKQVVEQCANNHGLLASVKRHLPLIAEKIKLPPDFYDILRGPVIGVFTGHMFDAADRESSRFPIELKDQVAAEIGEMIDSSDIRIGYCSAACGGDLLFALEMIKRGRELNIVLPFAADNFRRTSVAFKDIDQSKDFWYVLEHASSVTVATDESHLNNPCLYTYAADLIEGYAKLRAIQCDGQVEVIAAIDPYTSGEDGGSLERAVVWLEEGLDVRVIDIAKLRGEQTGPNILPTIPKPDARRLDREIRSIVEISSNTHDDVIHRVLSQRLPQEGDFLQGEGINRAFATVQEAVDYCYLIRHEADNLDWQALDLPADTELQFAIHTGPIFPRSPSKARDYFGTHVFYTRDLAEVTPPGCFYLTEQAAALLQTHGPANHTADYLGVMDVKGKPRQIYRLQRV